MDKTGKWIIQEQNKKGRGYVNIYSLKKYLLSMLYPIQWQCKRTKEAETNETFIHGYRYNK